MAIKVLIVDDMVEFQRHFTMLLENETDIEVVGIASSRREAVALYEELHPNVVLMDIQMESDDAGILATKEINAKGDNVKIIILTIHAGSENIMDAYMMGATDFITKTAPVAEILSAIRNAMDEASQWNNANRIIRNEMIKLKKERESFLRIAVLISRLSKSEMEIVKMLCEGKRYSEISAARFVEEVTIRGMVNKISKKVGMPIRKFIEELDHNGIDRLI